MDMGSMAMQTTTNSAMSMGPSASASAMSMSMGNDCQISMLWNWYTVDACFISATWQITSPGMFAGSCIGVILLVMSLAFLRRLHRAYDARIIQQMSMGAVRPLDPDAEDSNASGSNKKLQPRTIPPATMIAPRRYSIVQQAIRAFLHMVEFAVAYFIMLLAMYYNGYIIICILIGAFLGYLVFEWEAFISPPAGTLTGGATEVTGCCG